MADLLVAAVVMMGLSLVVLIMAERVSRHWPEDRTVALAGTVLAALLLFVFRYHGTWRMARLLPLSSVIVFGNWIPLGGAFLAGVTLGQRKLPRWRRLGIASLILLLSCYSVGCCFLGQLPAHCGSPNHWSGVTQSRRSSCGARCAAELLQHHGIDASEEEMIGPCLTSYRGCPALGLYRGLKLKTANTDWDVGIVTCTIDELVRTEGPLLLRVHLPAAITLGAYSRSGHLTDGVVNKRTSGRRLEHAVLLMGPKDSDHVKVFDPAMRDNRLVTWSVEDLHERWPGEALRLVRRSSR